jgi:hypothetical protein
MQHKLRDAARLESLHESQRAVKSPTFRLNWRNLSNWATLDFDGHSTLRAAQFYCWTITHLSMLDGWHHALSLCENMRICWPH